MPSRWRPWRARRSPSGAAASCRSLRRSGRCWRRAWGGPMRCSPCSRRAQIWRSKVAWRCLLLSLLLACKREEAPEAEKLPRVRVQVAAPALLTPRIPIAGVLAPLPGHDVKVGALVPGRVDTVYVAEGDPVKT